MAKKFTKLFLGDVVKTVGGKAFRKLNTTTTPTLITFTIDSTTYQAEEGMTWLEWVGSNYNTDNEWVCTSGSSRVVGTYIYNYSYITKDGTAVVGNDVINNGYAYGTQNTGQGGGAG